MANQYVVSGNLRHNETDYADGSLFSTDDKTLEATLLRHGTLLTLEQYQRQAEANADVAAVQKALALREQTERDAAEKDAKIAELEAKLAQQEADKSGEDSTENLGEGNGSSDSTESESAGDSQPSDDSAEA